MVTDAVVAQGKLYIILGQTMRELYDRHKSNDDFIYIKYREISSFG